MLGCILYHYNVSETFNVYLMIVERTLSFMFLSFIREFKHAIDLCAAKIFWMLRRF